MRCSCHPGTIDFFRSVVLAAVYQAASFYTPALSPGPSEKGRDFWDAVGLGSQKFRSGSRQESVKNSEYQGSYFLGGCLP